MVYEGVIKIPNIYRRKLLQSGDSICVALPPSWLRYFKLKVGDEVEVVSNNEVTVRVVKKKERR